MTTNRNIFMHFLGTQYQTLPPAIKAFHDDPTTPWKGHVNANGSNNLLAKIARKIMGLPKPAKNLPITISVDYINEYSESWTRTINGVAFSTLLTINPNPPQYMQEKWGLTSEYFALEVRDNKLCWNFQYHTILGFKLPRLLAPKVIAEERVDENGNYQFFASATLPMIGKIIEYKGSLARTS